jgi:hypothetical protein
VVPRRVGRYVHIVHRVEGLLIVPAQDRATVQIRFPIRVWIVRLEIIIIHVVHLGAPQATDLSSSDVRMGRERKIAVTNAFLTKTARPDTASLIQAQTPQ